MKISQSSFLFNSSPSGEHLTWSTASPRKDSSRRIQPFTRQIQMLNSLLTWQLLRDLNAQVKTEFAFQTFLLKSAELLKSCSQLRTVHDLRLDHVQPKQFGKSYLRKGTRCFLNPPKGAMTISRAMKSRKQFPRKTLFGKSSQCQPEYLRDYRPFCIRGFRNKPANVHLTETSFQIKISSWDFTYHRKFEQQLFLLQLFLQQTRISQCVLYQQKITQRM